MFEEVKSVEEVNAEKVIQERIPVIIKKIIATSIYMAMKYAREQSFQCLQLPKTYYYKAAVDLRFIIAQFIVKYIDDNNFVNVKYNENINEKGLPTPEILIDNIVVHLKKHNKQETLPGFSKKREVESLKNEQLTLGFEEEYGYYCLATYDHKRFNIKYIQIGVPNESYSKWLGRENLLGYIDRDLAERVEKAYSAEIKEEIANNIKKEFKLEVK